MTDTSTRQRPLTDEEQALWRQAMRDTVPLRPAVSSPESPPPPPQPPPSAPPSADVPPIRPPLPAITPALVPPRPTLPPLLIGNAVGIDRRTNQRLRRGELEIDGRIDLHGLTQNGAHDALCRYLDDSLRAGRRCVLVITGKGAVSQGGGVLRNSVPRWLAEPGLRGGIIAVHRAQPQHGGDGALYVLLRRQRAQG